jgi:hypothetical protein
VTVWQAVYKVPHGQKREDHIASKGKAQFLVSASMLLSCS